MKQIKRNIFLILMIPSIIIALIMYGLRLTYVYFIEFPWSQSSDWVDNAINRMESLADKLNKN